METLSRKYDSLLADLWEQAKAANETIAIYEKTLKATLRVPWIAGLITLIVMAGAVGLYRTIPSEFTPKEDRGAFFIITNSPEGATYGYIVDVMEEVEKRLMYLVEQEEAIRVLIRAPRGFGNISDYNVGLTIIVLSPWEQRRSAWEIMDEVKVKLADIPGVKNFVVMRQGLTRGLQKPVQFVIGGPTYEQLAEWRDIILDAARENPGLTGVDYDYKETKPQILVNIDQSRAGDLGVTIQSIGQALESLLGSRRVTTFIQDGEEYDVVIEGLYDGKRTPNDLSNIYVRSESTNELIPLANLVTLEEIADSGTLNRYNRMRSITIEANLNEGYPLSEALDFLENVAAEKLPEDAMISYKGESLDFKESGGSTLFVFALALVVVYLVLAAQFESFVHPITILLSAPVAVGGGLLGLLVFGLAQNIYTQIGSIMLIGLAAKNGILIVEFINQLRDDGTEFEEAILRASVRRLRPIVMTGLTTVMGSLPLIISSGAGSETRFVIGVVIMFGVALSALLALILAPLAYRLIARNTSSPETRTKQLEAALEKEQESFIA